MFVIQDFMLCGSIRVCKINGLLNESFTDEGKRVLRTCSEVGWIENERMEKRGAWKDARNWPDCPRNTASRYRKTIRTAS